jgi:hypothetical protein
MTGTGSKKMRRIINKPIFFYNICPVCGVRFVYEEVDIQKVGDLASDIYNVGYSVGCPNCATEINHTLENAIYDINSNISLDKLKSSKEFENDKK